MKHFIHVNRSINTKCFFLGRRANITIHISTDKFLHFIRFCLLQVEALNSILAINSTTIRWRILNPTLKFYKMYFIHFFFNIRDLPAIFYSNVTKKKKFEKKNVFLVAVQFIHTFLAFSRKVSK